MVKQGEICGLAHIGVFVDNVDVSEKFYVDILEFSVIWQCELEDGTRISFVRNGDCVVEIVQPVGGGNKGDGVVAHIALNVRNIEAVQKKLMERGVKFETEVPVFSDRVFPNGAKWLMFRGPDGEQLEINEVL